MESEIECLNKFHIIEYTSTSHIALQYLLWSSFISIEFGWFGWMDETPVFPFMRMNLVQCTAPCFIAAFFCHDTWFRSMLVYFSGNRYAAPSRALTLSVFASCHRASDVIKSFSNAFPAKCLRVPFHTPNHESSQAVYLCVHLYYFACHHIMCFAAILVCLIPFWLFHEFQSV